MKTTRSAHPVHPKIGVIGVQTILAAILGLAMIFTLSCDSASNPSALVGRWIGGDTKKPRDMEFFKDGTGVCDGVGVSWKVEDKRLIVLSPTLGFVSDYEVSGYKLTLSDSIGKIKYVNINNKEYPQKGILIDPRDGRKYGTVEIGHQIWIVENLDYNAEGSKCYGKSESNCQKYGRLYNWETAKKACPSGWHLPGDAEWQILVDFAGGGEIAGKKLKAKSEWENDGNGTDDYGFSALPGGYGTPDDTFRYANGYGNWWSANEHDNLSAYLQFMRSSNEDVGLGNLNKRFFFSVRCLQD